RDIVVGQQPGTILCVTRPVKHPLYVFRCGSKVIQSYTRLSVQEISLSGAGQYNIPYASLSIKYMSRRRTVEFLNDRRTHVNLISNPVSFLIILEWIIPKVACYLMLLAGHPSQRISCSILPAPYAWIVCPDKDLRLIFILIVVVEILIIDCQHKRRIVTGIVLSKKSMQAPGGHKGRGHVF